MIADAIKQAQRIHRQMLEAAYDGNLTVLEYQQVKNPKTKLTEQKEVVVLEKQPCRLSLGRGSRIYQLPPRNALHRVMQSKR